MPPASAFIALGSNLPWNGVSGAALLTQAVSALEEAGLPILARSSVWQTEAWPPNSGQPDYFNAVVELDPGGLGPQPLYERLREIEAHFGRVRRERYGARTLDLDIIAMGDLSGNFGGIELPHSRMHERSFVLEPLLEIAPLWRSPHGGITAAAILASLPEAGRGSRLEGWGDAATALRIAKRPENY